MDQRSGARHKCNGEMDLEKGILVIQGFTGGGLNVVDNEVEDLGEDGRPYNAGRLLGSHQDDDIDVDSF